MAGELASNARGSLALLVKVVNGADVVETTAGNVVAAGGVGASHDPRRAQRNRVDLVGCVSIPDDELAILGRRNQMPPVRRPVHGVDLGQMSLERSLRLHKLIPGDRLMGLLGDRPNCSGEKQEKVSRSNNTSGPTKAFQRVAIDGRCVTYGWCLPAHPSSS